MNYRPPRRSGRVSMILIILTCVTILSGAIFVFTRGPSNDGSDQTVVLHRVERGNFEAFVTEPGDVSSSSNVEVRCRVKSHVTAGTDILKIREEGANVKLGDFLIQFNDSLLKKELLAQKIVVTNDKALLIQADSNLQNARRTLREFEQGTYQLELDLLDGEVFVAEEGLQRTGASLVYGKRLFARGYITGLQLKAEQFAHEKAKKDLAAARRKLDVYKRFTREKMIGEYEAEIKKQAANVEAATITLELSELRRAEIKQQIDYCLVKAPAAGQVVYATEHERGDAAQVIEEGTLIRENKVVVRLPDLQKMQVDVRINEAYVNRVKAGQPARIELDADPDAVLHGKVEEVAPYPYPVRWHGAPIEFGAVITIIDPPPTIRPGLRAKVKIMFESKPDVLQVPLAAVIEHGDCHYCLIREEQGWRTQMVKIGPNNYNQVIVEKGLSEGDQVSLTPFRHIQRSDLPDGQPSEVATDKKSSRHSIKPALSGDAAKVAPAS